MAAIRIAVFAAILALGSLAARGQENHTGLYWDPEQSGWGMHLSHQGDVVFATIFSYLGGRPVWLVSSDARHQGLGVYEGRFYHTTGTPFGASQWGAPAVRAGGTFLLQFLPPDRIMVSLIAGPLGNFSIFLLRKQVYASPPTCVFTAGSREGATNFQDLWWNPAESGWGLSLAHQGDIVFATLFVYGAAGEPSWVVGSNVARDGDASYSGVLYRGQGGGSYTRPFQWTEPTFTQVGQIRLDFASGTRGTLTYTLDGTTVVKPIQRQVFATPLPLCS